MKVIATLLSASIVCYSVCYAAPPVAEEREGMPPKNRVLRCIRRTGLDEFFHISRYSLVRIPRVTLPFSPPIAGKRALLVELTPGTIHWKEPMQNLYDPYIRQFFIYLDPDARFLLMITSKILGQRPPRVSTPIMRALRGRSTEEFGPPPLTDPNFTFVQTLEELRRHGRGELLLATEFDAYYVMYTKMREKYHPAWIIRTRGEPPEPHSTPYFPEEEHRDPNLAFSTVHRDCVDATEGKVMQLESGGDSL